MKAKSLLITEIKYRAAKDWQKIMTYMNLIKKIPIRFTSDS